MRRSLQFVLLSLLISASPVVAGPKIPDDVQQHVKALVGEHICTGVVLGMVDDSGSTFIAYGKTGVKDHQEVNENTIFEIGSISKVFTSILLCEAVEAGKVKLDDPIAKYMPKDVKVPERDGKQITFGLLATHHSGLPRMPDNFDPADSENPYADYTEKELFAFLTKCKLTRNPGATYEYSNLGMGLVGDLLSRISGKPYGELLHDGVTQPLGMKDTCVHVPADKLNRFAEGHVLGKTVAHWDFGALAGAGAIRSTGRDMARFLSFNMGLKSSPIDAALEAAQKRRSDTVTPDLQIALGWHVWNKHGTEIIWHNGQTAGFHSFCGFRKDKKLGVVILVNDAYGTDEIGLHALEPKFELKKIRESIDVDPKILDRYVGWYLMNKSLTMHITRDGDLLKAKLTGQPAVPIYPVAEDRFIYRIVKAELDFDRNDKGEPTAVVLHQNGQALRFDRTDDYTPPPPPKEVKVDVKVLKQYVGRYQLAPSVVFDITLKGDQLMAQLTGQPRYPVFPESQTEFFYKVVDAQLTFVKDDKGRVVALILHQYGMDRRAEKVD